MTNNEIEKRLQEFAKTFLEKTVYGDDSDNYQEEQLNWVIEEIHDIYSVTPHLQIILPQISLVPAISDIGSAKTEKIGTSAHKCLQMLQTGNYREELGDVFSVVVEYLTQVVIQSRSAFSERAETQMNDVGNAIIRLFKEHMEELKKITKDNEAQTRQAEQAALSVQKLLKSAESAANDAKQSALSAKHTSAKARNQAKIAQGIVDDATDDIKKVESTADSIIPNMLTVLGIFVSIIVAVVCCYLGNLVINTSDINHDLPIEFMRYLLMGHIIVAVTFLLLYLIAKLTNRSISTHCSKFEKSKKAQAKLDSIRPKNTCIDFNNRAPTECDYCQNRCGAMARFRLLYAYMFAINILFFIGYIITGVWQVINVYYRGKFDKWMKGHGWCVLAVAILVLLVLIIVSYFVFKKKSPQKKNKKCENSK